MGHVFISYSHVDSSTVDEIVRVLEDLGVPYFRDIKGIGWGDSITSEVRTALDEAAAILVVVSPASLKSQWVPYELGYCTGLRRRVLPFLTHPSLDVPAYISDLKHLTQLEELRAFFSSSESWTELGKSVSQEVELRAKIYSQRISQDSDGLGFFASFANDDPQSTIRDISAYGTIDGATGKSLTFMVNPVSRLRPHEDIDRVPIGFFSNEKTYEDVCREYFPGFVPGITVNENNEESGSMEFFKIMFLYKYEVSRPSRYKVDREQTLYAGLFPDK